MQLKNRFIASAGVTIVLVMTDKTAIMEITVSSDFWVGLTVISVSSPFMMLTG
jgi:hypothetical protein